MTTPRPPLLLMADFLDAEAAYDQAFGRLNAVWQDDTQHAELTPAAEAAFQRYQEAGDALDPWQATELRAEQARLDAQQAAIVEWAQAHREWRRVSRSQMIPFLEYHAVRNRMLTARAALLALAEPQAQTEQEAL